METKETHELTHEDCVKSRGCWLNSDRGRYIGEAVQEEARERGWTGESLDADAEWYDEATDEAESYLNDLLPDGWSFGTSEAGDWGLWPIDCPSCAGFGERGDGYPGRTDLKCSDCDGTGNVHKIRP